MVAQAALGHRLEGAGHHRLGLGIAAAPPPVQKGCPADGDRELHRPGQPAMLLIVGGVGPRGHRAQHLVGVRQVRCGRHGGGGPGLVQQPLGDLAGLAVDFLAPVAPEVLDTVQQAEEAVAGKVGTAEERPLVRGQEDRHRPAAAAGQQLHRLHVGGVDRRQLLAVDLDADEMAVEHLGHRVVLEDLVLHDVAPVAGSIAAAEEDGTVIGAGQIEGRRVPGVPVDGVVGVLAQVEGPLLGQAVAGAADLGRRAAGTRMFHLESPGRFLHEPRCGYPGLYLYFFGNVSARTGAGMG